MAQRLTDRYELKEYCFASLGQRGSPAKGPCIDWRLIRTKRESPYAHGYNNMREWCSDGRKRKWCTDAVQNRAVSAESSLKHHKYQWRQIIMGKIKEVRSSKRKDPQCRRRNRSADWSGVEERKEWLQLWQRLRKFDIFMRCVRPRIMTWSAA